jgi:hypothetical protein
VAPERRISSWVITNTAAAASATRWACLAVETTSRFIKSSTLRWVKSEEEESPRTAGQAKTISETDSRTRQSANAEVLPGCAPGPPLSCTNLFMTTPFGFVVEVLGEASASLRLFSRSGAGLWHGRKMPHGIVPSHRLRFLISAEPREALGWMLLAQADGFAVPGSSHARDVPG